MNNSYIPSILKEKLSLFFTYSYGIVHFIIFIFLSISLLSFDINDNSFLTKSSQTTNNLGGEIGSYVSSFIFYTFGLMGYAFILFFFITSFLVLRKKKPKFFFIRLFLFFISLIFIPQTFIYMDVNLNAIDHIEDWGIVSKNIYLIHKINYLCYFLSFVGIILFLSCLNLHQLFKISKLRFNFSRTEKKTTTFTGKKKEPIISNLHINNAESVQYKKYEKEEEKNDNNFSSPSLDILENEKINSNRKLEKENIKENSSLLEKVFKDFNIEIQVMTVKLGPVVTLYEILPSAGTKVNTIINLAGDISRSMGVGAVRISQIYGTQFLGVEIPNKFRETVTIKELLSDNNFKNTEHKIPICIGKDISGTIEVIDLSKTPHLLVAGTTGSGKSVFINTLLASILYRFSPKELRLILIDPKMLELSVYNDIAHLLTPVVTEPKKAIIALKWVCKEMERRYSLMNEENTRSLEGFNEKSEEKIPYIVVFIDEMADLMMTAGKEVEHYVQRLAQMARACGIHLVMATQRPSVDIITGSIKANFPSRISFQVASKYDSRTVLGEIGAEQLLGNGDMLMSKNGANLIRYQSAFISDNEVNKLINEIKRSQKVQYLKELDEVIHNNDENFDSLSDEDEALIAKSIDLIKTSNKASTSFLQRNFQIGYNKAARIMEALELRGVVSPPNHAGKREILINR